MGIERKPLVKKKFKDNELLLAKDLNSITDEVNGGLPALYSLTGFWGLVPPKNQSKKNFIFVKNDTIFIDLDLITKSGALLNIDLEIELEKSYLEFWIVLQDGRSVIKNEKPEEVEESFHLLTYRDEKIILETPVFSPVSHFKIVKLWDNFINLLKTNQKRIYDYCKNGDLITWHIYFRVLELISLNQYTSFNDIIRYIKLFYNSVKVSDTGFSNKLEDILKKTEALRAFKAPFLIELLNESIALLYSWKIKGDSEYLLPFDECPIIKANGSHIWKYRVHPESEYKIKFGNNLSFSYQFIKENGDVGSRKTRDIDKDENILLKNDIEATELHIMLGTGDVPKIKT
nr:hypothetical protein 1 [Candidatus Aminicenantes bacterium]